MQNFNFLASREGWFQSSQVAVLKERFPGISYQKRSSSCFNFKIGQAGRVNPPEICIRHFKLGYQLETRVGSIYYVNTIRSASAKFVDLRCTLWVYYDNVTVIAGKQRVMNIDLNEVDVCSIKYVYSDILLKKHKTSLILLI